MTPRFVLLVLLVTAALLDHTGSSADAATAAPNQKQALEQKVKADAAAAATALKQKPVLDRDKQKFKADGVNFAQSEKAAAALKETIKDGTKYSIGVYMKNDNAHAFAKISGGAEAAAIELWLDDKIEQNPLLSYIMLRLGNAKVMPAAWSKPGFIEIGKIDGLDGKDIRGAIDRLPAERVGLAYDVQTNYCGFIVAELLAMSGADEKEAINVINALVAKQVANAQWGKNWDKFTDKNAAVEVLRENLATAFGRLQKKPAAAVAAAAPTAAATAAPTAAAPDAKKVLFRQLSGLQPRVL